MATDASQWPMEAFQLRFFAMYIKNRNKSRQLEGKGKGDRAENKVNKCAKKSNKCKRERERNTNITKLISGKS